MRWILVRRRPDSVARRTHRAGESIVKFGVLQFFSWPGRRVPLATVYERAFQRMEVMDKTGYDAVWLAEHHFSTYSVCPSVHIMGTHIAARTKNLRIGTAVSLASFYHPLRLADEICMLDQISRGRLELGFGRGASPTGWSARSPAGSRCSTRST